MRVLRMTIYSVQSSDIHNAHLTLPKAFTGIPIYNVRHRRDVMEIADLSSDSRNSLKTR